VIVRDFRPEDYAELARIWVDAGLPFKGRGRDGRDQLARQIASGAVFVLVAEDAGRILGAVLGSHDGRKGWLNRLAVIPEYRRAPVGVAVRLVAASEERFRALRLEIFACLIEDESVDSRRLMERLGYRRIDDIGYFAKKLRPDI